MTPDVQVLPFGTEPFDQLREAIDFRQLSVRLFGRSVPQPRLVAWYGPCPYTYSGLTLPAAPMPAAVERLRARVEELTGHRFNSVLANLYRDGSDSVSWHSDDEPLFGSDPTIASLSFGQARRFLLRSKRCRAEKIEFDLVDGSLLLMGSGVQADWEHAVPKTKLSVGPRINLTFRHALD